MVYIDKAIQAKIMEKHQVSCKEVRECFLNRNGDYLVDDREDNRTDPATLWFLARTNCDRLLKVCFIYSEERGTSFLKTAYAPNEAEIELYSIKTGLSEEEM